MELSKEWYHTELANSEYEMLHRSPTVEYSFYNAVKTGDMDSVIRNCKEDAREFDTLKSKKVPQSLEIGLFFCQIFIFII